MHFPLSSKICWDNKKLTVLFIAASGDKTAHVWKSTVTLPPPSQVTAEANVSLWNTWRWKFNQSKWWEKKMISETHYNWIKCACPSYTWCVMGTLTWFDSFYLVGYFDCLGWGAFVIICKRGHTQGNQQAIHGHLQPWMSTVSCYVQEIANSIKICLKTVHICSGMNSPRSDSQCRMWVRWGLRCDDDFWCVSSIRYDQTKVKIRSFCRLLQVGVCVCVCVCVCVFVLTLKSAQSSVMVILMNFVFCFCHPEICAVLWRR